MTGEPHENKTLHPNQAVRTLVRDFLDECERAGTDPHALV